MKKFILPLVLLSFGTISAQIGINTDEPKTTLDVTGMPTDISKLDGIMAPRITGEELRAKTYTAEQTGALVYVTTADTAPSGQTEEVNNEGYYYFSGDKWVAFESKNTSWSLNGNANTVPGVSEGENYIGTSDDTDIVFKRGDAQAGWINKEDKNTSFGNSSLGLISTGGNNTAMGSGALHSNTTGTFNSAFGVSALGSNTSGRYNVAIGSSVLVWSNGSSNTAIGHNALQQNTSGNNNVAVGNNSNNRNTEGNGNVSVGNSALIYNTGSFNTAIGNLSGNTNNFSGSYNVLIGHATRTSSNTSERELNIGNTLFGTGIGISTTPGNIGIGSVLPKSKLEVNGAITNQSSLSAPGTTVDFSKSNLAYRSSSVPVSAINLTQMKDGGVYKLAVQGTTSGTATFTAKDMSTPAENLTVKYRNNGPTQEGSETIYTFTVIGTSVYVDMATGYN